MKPATTYILISAAVITGLTIGAVELAHAIRPAPKIQIPCEVIEVVDGDTVTIRVTLDARIRPLDLWAPEPNTEAGKASTENLRQHVAAHGPRGVLTIPLDQHPVGRGGRLDDYLTFGRPLGHIELDGAGETISAYQVRTGHATRTRE